MLRKYFWGYKYLEGNIFLMKLCTSEEHDGFSRGYLVAIFDYDVRTPLC